MHSKRVHYMYIRIFACSASLQGPAEASKSVLDTDETQVPTATLLDMEAERLARLNSSSVVVPSLPDPPAPRPN